MSPTEPATRGASQRSRAPVFTVGSPRSGTTLLYHMLLSSGGFARYRTETHVFNAIGPRFGGLHTEADRRQALEVWLASGCHELSGLAADEVRSVIERECRSAGDFLRLIMEAMVKRQGAVRWAETTPAHLLHMREIKAQIPDALFVHVVRDGRDVAASLARQGWVRPLAVDRDRPALAAAASWDWTVRRGRDEGSGVGGDYIEVKYEALLDEPHQTLRRLGEFMEHPLDWDQIQRVGIGSVGRPNTSFPGAASSFQGRWRTELSAEDARDVDAMLASTLRSFGYTSDATSRPALASRTLAYAARFAFRDALKRRTPLGRRLTDLSFFAPGAMAVTAEKLGGVTDAQGMDGGAAPSAESAP